MVKHATEDVDWNGVIRFMFFDTQNTMLTSILLESRIRHYHNKKGFENLDSQSLFCKEKGGTTSS